MACMWVLLVVVPSFCCMSTCRLRVGGGDSFFFSSSADARMTTTKEKKDHRPWWNGCSEWFAGSQGAEWWHWWGSLE